MHGWKKWNYLSIVTHRMSSPLVTVLRRRVPNPVGSMPPKPPIFDPKNVSNKSNGFVCKKKITNLNLPYRNSKRWVDRVKTTKIDMHFNFFP